MLKTINRITWIIGTLVGIGIGLALIAETVEGLI